MVVSARNELVSNAVRVGVDIGGTFTDLMLIGESGDVEIGKVLTTPDPSRGVEEVLLRTLEGSGRSGASVRHLVHGTTLVTNAIIERKGAPTALLTSAGFRDSIEIGREHRYELYDLNLEHPKPLVPRHLRFAVPERTLADGTQGIELDEVYVGRLAGELAEAGVEAVAICFLHSFTNPDSERRARSAVKREASQLRVALSSEVVPEIGEFETGFHDHRQCIRSALGRALPVRTTTPDGRDGVRGSAVRDAVQRWRGHSGHLRRVPDPSARIGSGGGRGWLRRRWVPPWAGTRCCRSIWEAPPPS